MITFNRSAILLESILDSLDGSQKLTTFAMLSLGIVEALENATSTPEEMVRNFYSGDNCLYVRRRLKDKAADEIMSRGVQLPDLFDALNEHEANDALRTELESIRSLSLGILRRIAPEQRTHAASRPDVADDEALSATYQRIKKLLDQGWSGTYGDLAVAVGHSAKSGRVIGRLVKGYAKRHPEWPNERVYRKDTRRPANE
jgi:hypothetical protein